MIILLFDLKYFVVHSLLPVAFVLLSFRLKLKSVNLYQLYIDLLDGQCFFRLCNTRLHYGVIFSRVFACGRSLWVCTYFAGIPSISFHRSRWADFSSVTTEIHGMETRCGRNAQFSNELSYVAFNVNAQYRFRDEMPFLVLLHARFLQVTDLVRVWNAKRFARKKARFI